MVTKRTLISTCALVVIGLIGAQLALKTAERQFSSQSDPANKASYLIKKASQQLLKKIYSPKALDEFRDQGTIQGRSLDQFVSDEWALILFKPTMPWVPFQTIRTASFDDVAFSPDSTQLALRSGNILYLWMLQSTGFWKNMWHSSIHHENDAFVKFIVFSPDGKKIFTPFEKDDRKNDNARVHAYVSKEEKIKTAPTWTQKALFNSDGKRIIVFGRDIGRFGKLRHVAFMSTRQSLNKKGPQEWVSQELRVEDSEERGITSATFSQDDTHIISLSQPHPGADNQYPIALDLWLLESSAFLNHQSKIVFTKEAPLIVFSENLQHFITASNGQLRLLTLQSDYSVNSLSLEIQGSIEALSPDGKKIIASKNRTWFVSVQQPDGSWKEQSLNTFVDGNVATFTPDGEKIIISFKNDKSPFTNSPFFIWSQTTNGLWKSQKVEDPRKFTRHNKKAVFIPDNKYLISFIPHTHEPARLWKELDLIGTKNVMPKIMLLELLERDGNIIFEDRPHLQKIFATFEPEAKEYLTRVYSLSKSLSDSTQETSLVAPEREKETGNTPVNKP